MGTIVISTNTTLDGVVQDPDGQEGFRLGGWFNTYGGADLQAWAELETKEAMGAAALLLGRRSDAWFAPRWAGRAGVWAERLDAMPKYVVSTTLAEPAWTNATVLRGDLVEETERLRREIEGEILVYASYRLGRALLDHDLVDELRLVVFPVVLGAGERLFGAPARPKALRLAGTRPVGEGLVMLSYRRA
jgi:dihydrofolate reductase